MVWLISAKKSRYDHASAFAKFGFIDWTQNLNYQIGDTVYIYYGKPTKKVMYKCIVEKCNMLHSERVYDKEYWVDPADFENRYLHKYICQSLQPLKAACKAGVTGEVHRTVPCGFLRVRGSLLRPRELT